MIGKAFEGNIFPGTLEGGAQSESTANEKMRTVVATISKGLSCYHGKTPEWNRNAGRNRKLRYEGSALEQDDFIQRPGRGWCTKN